VEVAALNAWRARGFRTICKRMAEYIHGGTDPREVARLEKQARYLGPFILKNFVAHPGERVLDLATGVGAMATELLRRYPGIELFGLDLRRAQLETARRREPSVRFVQGDATALPFPDDTFARIHCSWLLEHVPDPVAILREVRRVLKPGGVAQFVEVDNATFEMTPELPVVRDVIDALNAVQIDGGGDPFVGQKLGALFGDAGFARVKRFPMEIRAQVGDGAHFQGMIDEWAEIFESLDEALPAQAEQLHRAADALRGLVELPLSELRYCGQIAQATK
jgi:ubiquinone/menaquinone biosynthesis C-methylase UbiE